LRRHQISRHHTVTHLLYSALRDEFEEKISAYRAVVTYDKLCFDFFYTGFLTEKQIISVEMNVYSKILMNYPVLTFMTSQNKAREICFVNTLNENYEDTPRVCQINDVSCEICYGTHCIQTGEIGAFKIIEQSQRGDGIYRLEAVAGMAAYFWIEQHLLNKG